jgi:hypothetical protein
MATDLQSTDAIVHLPNALVQYVARDAEIAADLVAAFLEEIGLLKWKPDGTPEPFWLPPDFLLELGAAVQVQLWHVRGVADLLGNELPDLQAHGERLQEIAKRGTAGLEELKGLDLSRQVMQVAIRRLSWAAPNILESEVVLSPMDEESLDKLAKFLWNNRHKFST